MTDPTQPAWPSSEQLAVLSSTVHWQLEQAAYDLPAGRMGPDAERKLAKVLEQLAAAYRAHAESRPSPAPRELPAADPAEPNR